MSSRQFSYVLWSKAHNHWLLRTFLLGCKRKLPPPVCQTWASLCGLPTKGHAVPWYYVHMYSASSVKGLSPVHFLCTQCLQPLQKKLLLPTPNRQPSLNSAGGPGPLPQIMTFVFLNPFSSIAFLSFLCYELS